MRLFIHTLPRERSISARNGIALFLSEMLRRFKARANRLRAQAMVTSIYMYIARKFRGFISRRSSMHRPAVSWRDYEQRHGWLGRVLDDIYSLGRRCRALRYT